MQRLRAAVAPDSGGEVYVLHGLGGCGKTAVAYTLFQHATTDAGRVGLWVNASDTASLRAGMLAVAADRGAGEGELAAARSGLRAAADLVWDHLDRSDQRWLLVLDNADDPAVLRDGSWLRSSSRGTVLVTTRQAGREWWPHARFLHVGVLPREEAAQVLCDLAPGTGTPEEAADVADRLGRLPLALTLAGGFLAHQVIEPWTMTRYGTVLDGNRELDPVDLLDRGAAAFGGQDSRHLVRTTWQLSLDTLATQGLPESIALLRLLACWAGDPLPVSLLVGADELMGFPPGRLEPALRGLLEQSLIELVPGEVRCLRTHGVLLDSVSAGTPSEEREALVAVAARLMGAVLPEVPHRGVPDARIRLTTPHVLALLQKAVSGPAVGQPVVEEAMECALRLTTALHRWGDYSGALALAEQCGALAPQRLGEDHPIVLRLRQRAGCALYRLARNEEAEALHRRTLADCERAFGESAADTLTSALQLSRLLGQTGRTAESVTLARRAVAGRTASLGPTAPLTLIAKLYLLETPGEALEEAVATGDSLVTDCRDVMGPVHPISLAAELDYGWALTETGRPAEALPWLRSAVAAHESSYGSHYPITLAARSSLARTLSVLGEQAEAREQYETVATVRALVLGPGHPWTLLAEGELAKLGDA